MDVRETGIILRLRPLTETSLIVQWITRESGRLSTVAKGARRPKSLFRGKLDLFYKADFSFSRSSRSELHNLKEVSLIETHPRLRENYELLEQAAYISRLIELSTETEAELGVVYGLVEGFLHTINKSKPSPRYVLTFEWRLLEELGLRPDLEKLAPPIRKFADLMLIATWEEIADARISSTEGQQLAQFMHGYLIYHLGKVPSGRNTVMLKGGKQKGAE